MLKFLGISLLLSGTAGIGFGKARELDQRVEELRMLRQLIMLLEGEIRCTHRPLPELLISLGERFGPPFQSFLVETGKELEAHKSLTVQEVWKEQLTLGRKKFHLVSYTHLMDQRQNLEPSLLEIIMIHRNPEVPRSIIIPVKRKRLR